VRGGADEEDTTVSPDDRETLEEYRRVMAELRVTELVREPISISATIGARQDRGKSRMPTEDALRGLFTAFRPLWLEGEPATFVKTCQVLYRATLTSDERTALDNARALWKARCREDWIRFKFNGSDMSPREFINLYFNGLYFHRDRDKRVIRETFEGAFGAEFGKGMLLTWVLDLVDAAASIEQVVTNVLGRETAQASTPSWGRTMVRARSNVSDSRRSRGRAILPTPWLASRCSSQ